MTERASPADEASPPPAAGTRPSFLPSEVDPTVFDEAFLRQLERLLLIMRSPVRGGLKGGRRSVKRGQSVEFADYREYTLGDDLRQLDLHLRCDVGASPAPADPEQVVAEEGREEIREAAEIEGGRLEAAAA